MSNMESGLKALEEVYIKDVFPKQNELVQLIHKARAVSFDFFDTLFIRPLAHPEDAFDILGRQFGIAGFRQHRWAAQIEAFKRMQAAGRKEISLADIYECFPDVGFPPGQLARAEYELELALVEPNPELFPLFRDLVDAGKTVVITSDMYLGADFFVEVLEPHGLAHVPLFISADCNATKRDAGDLFDVVSARLGLAAEDILHIGDNLLGDVTRPGEKGLMTFHYQAGRHQDVRKGLSLTTSLGRGLLRTRARDIRLDSFNELGFIHGGAANLGFLQWIKERARLDGIDHVLFLSRDGYALERIARSQGDSGIPDFCYFLGSRTTYTLAAMKADNFHQFLPFLLSGSEGLAPFELLERIGVIPPAPRIMEDLGLGADVRVCAAVHERVVAFLYAYRWEILKICQRNRRALYQYLKQLRIRAGSRIALVDVGWSGTTQEAFELAVRPMMSLEVFGYYFCLADTPERWQREKTQRMSAMVTESNTSADIVTKIYANRVAVELFFSAPHHSVIGLQAGHQGVEPILDAGRGNTGSLLHIAEEISHGVESFAEHYELLRQRLDFRASPLEIAWPLIELIMEEKGEAYRLLNEISNFDAWGSSRNLGLSLASYSS